MKPCQLFNDGWSNTIGIFSDTPYYKSLYLPQMYLDPLTINLLILKIYMHFNSLTAKGQQPFS